MKDGLHHTSAKKSSSSSNGNGNGTVNGIGIGAPHSPRGNEHHHRHPPPSPRLHNHHHHPQSPRTHNNTHPNNNPHHTPPSPRHPNNHVNYHNHHHHPTTRRLLIGMVCVLTCFGLATQTIWQSLYLTNATTTTKDNNEKSSSSSSVLSTRNGQNNNITSTTTTSSRNIRASSTTTTTTTLHPQHHDSSDAAIPKSIPPPPRVVQWLDWDDNLIMNQNEKEVVEDHVDDASSLWLPTKATFPHNPNNNITATMSTTSHSHSSSSWRPELPVVGYRTLDYPMNSQSQEPETNNTTTTTIDSSSSPPPPSPPNTGEVTLRDFERPFYEDCEPVLKHKVHIHPTCNGLHELDFATVTPSVSLLSVAGSWRTVWKVLQPPGSSSSSSSVLHATNNDNDSSWNVTTTAPPLILKVLNLERPLDEESFAIHAVDSIVMDRLTASPHVVSSYGFCGCSTITEFASQSGRDTLKESTLTIRTRLRLARDLARGLAELHASVPLIWDDVHGNRNGNTGDMKQQSILGPPPSQPQPSPPVFFAHHDINIANIVQIDRNLLDPSLHTNKDKDDNTNNDEKDIQSSKTKKKKPTKQSIRQEKDQKHIQIQWNDFNLGIWLRQPKFNNTFNTLSPSSSSSSSVMAASSSRRNSGNSHRNPTTITMNSDHCLAPVRYAGPLWRSPEEISNTSTVQVDQCDIYSLGNILFQLLTKRQPWTHLEENPTKPSMDIVAQAKQMGQYPRLPSKYYNDTTTTTSSSSRSYTGRLEKLVLYEAIQACFRFDPLQRPTAYELATALGTAYDWIRSTTDNYRTLNLSIGKIDHGDDDSFSLTPKSPRRHENQHPPQLLTLRNIQQLFEKKIEPS